MNKHLKTLANQNCEGISTWNLKSYFTKTRNYFESGVCFVGLNIIIYLPLVI